MKTQLAVDDLEISPQQLKNLELHKDYFLLDVRENREYQQKNLGGYLIPLNELPSRWQELPTDKLIVVHCRSGARSADAVTFLQSQGLKNCKNLIGGILAYNV